MGSKYKSLSIKYVERKLRGYDIRRAFIGIMTEWNRTGRDIQGIICQLPHGGMKESALPNRQQNGLHRAGCRGIMMKSNEDQYPEIAETGLANSTRRSRQSRIAKTYWKEAWEDLVSHGCP